MFFLMAASPAFAQEIFIHNGVTQQTGRPRDDSFAYAIGYMEGLGEHAAWSITYVNEGHMTTHKRDGLAPQIWGRQNILGRRLSLAVGVGPYLYYDTHIHPGREFHNHHGVGGIASAAATLYLGERLFVQARGNWIEAPHSSSTFSATGGIGYQLEKPVISGPLTGYSPKINPATYNELTLLSGLTTFNSIDNKDALAASVEYRRKIWRHFDLTVGWLYEGRPVSRTGPMAQIWATRSFFDDRLDLAAGFGPYLGIDRHGERNVTQVAYLASLTGSIRLFSHWALRGTWHRVGTVSTDHDTDVFLAGIVYRF
jgi:hypothetical protein